MKIDTSKSTILTIVIGLLVLNQIYLWKWAIIASLIVGIVGIISSYMSRKIECVWMKLAKILGYIMPNILLSIVYYIFLYPISALTKLFNKDPLMLSGEYSTYFVEIRKKMEKNSFEKLW